MFTAKGPITTVCGNCEEEARRERRPAALMVAEAGGGESRGVRRERRETLPDKDPLTGSATLPPTVIVNQPFKIPLQGLFYWCAFNLSPLKFWH